MLIHISYVQVQRRSPAQTLGSLFHDHLFSILFIFTGVFLVNYVLLSSAADESSNITLVNFQDGIELMNQVCQNSVYFVKLFVLLPITISVLAAVKLISSVSLACLCYTVCNCTKWLSTLSTSPYQCTLLSELVVA